MYLKTPKRYRSTRRRSIVSLRRLLLLILSPIVIFVGIGIYENRDMFSAVPDAVQRLWDDASSSLATAAAPTPTPTQDPTSRIEHAHTFWMQGAIEEALALYQENINAVPNDEIVHYRITLGLIIEGRFEEALEVAEHTVTANPFSANTWAVRAMALESVGDYGRALASALHALEIEEENARAMAFLAEVYLDLNQGDRALDIVNRAIELNPNSFEAYRVRGRIIQETRYDFVAAREDYQQAYDLAPNMIYPAIDLAWMDFLAGNHEDAVDRLNEIVVLNPNNARTLYTIGLFYYQGLGNYNRASDYLTRCVEAVPEHVECHYLRGRSQINLQQYTAAAGSFSMAVEYGSTNPRHYFWAGQAQIDLGNCAMALTFLHPGYELARQSGDTTLVSDFEYNLSQCQSPLGRPTPTPEETTENS